MPSGSPFRPLLRPRPRQWIGAAIEVAGVLVVAQRLVAWIG